MRDDQFLARIFGAAPTNASRSPGTAAAIAHRAKEIFSEDPEVYEALRDWFEFRSKLHLMDKLIELANRAESKAERDIEEDDRYGWDE